MRSPGVRFLVLGLAALICLPALAQVPDFEPPAPPPAESLRLKYLSYLVDTGTPYTALSYARGAPRDLLASGDQLDLRVALARLEAHFGLLEQASASYRRHLLPAVEPKLRNRMWFELAEAWELRGDYGQAQAALDSIFGPVPVEYYEQRVPMEARLLMAQGRYADAADKLRLWFSHFNRDPFARYNLGVTLVRAGELQEGAGELDTVGSMEANTAVELALKDKANLVLGFGYLEIGQGATARTLFQRVRLDGPFSDKALLGLGWAELAPDGDVQKRTVTKEIKCREDAARLLPEGLPVLRRIPRKACGPARRFRDTDKFARKKGAESEVERYKRALVPWLELVQRDPRELPVQEALSMVPYAYAKIGAPGSASRYYQNAIAQLEPQRQRVARTLAQLREQQTAEATATLPVGVAPAQAWLAGNPDLYNVSDTPYYRNILEDGRFQAVAQHLQDLTVLREKVSAHRRNLETLKLSLDHQFAAYAQSGYTAPAVLGQRQDVMQANENRLAGIASRLDAVINNTSAYLRRRALYFAQDYERHTNTYLSQVRIGMAQVSSADGYQ